MFNWTEPLGLASMFVEAAVVVLSAYTSRCRPRPSGTESFSTNVAFEPLNASGSITAVGPDFSMESSEVQPVTRLMRRQGWVIGCLYNQETNEHPQLYFSHMLAKGDPYELAHQIRKGLDLTDSE